MLTPKQLAEKGCVSLSTVYTLIRRGQLPAYRIPVNGAGKILIKWEDWESFLASCKISDWPREDEGELKYLK